MKLIKLSKKQNTTKKGLGYFEIYEKYFKEIRFKKLKILEIGVENGGSIRTWRRYFPRSKIVGLDIKKKDFNIKNVDLIQGDQSSSEVLNKLIKKYSAFDIIIDDGSHYTKHVIKSFKYLYKALKKEGLYIIEDLQTSYIPRYGGSRIRLNKKNTSMNYFKKLSDCVNYEHFNRPFYKKNKFDGLVKSVNFYQNIIFIRKGTTEKYYHSSDVKNTFIDFFKRIFSKFFN